jgi:hypothetical protein
MVTILSKMEFYGISGMVNKLMRSYLESRYERVSGNDAQFVKVSSKWELFQRGVPQGSITIPNLHK